MSLKLKRFSRGSKGSKKLVSLCEFGDETELLAYLKKKKNLQKINQPDKKGRYPIHILVSFPGRVNMVKILLEHGHADPNVIEAQTKNSVLHFAAQNHDLELFQFLINLPNLTVISSKNKDRDTPLHLFARTFNENPNNLLENFIKRGAEINAQNYHGETPLHFAVLKNHERIVEVLLQNGANPNLQNDQGETPLHWAAHAGDVKIVQLLMNHGADPSIKGAHGTALDVCYPSKTIRNLLNRGNKSNVNPLKLSHSDEEIVREQRGGSIPQTIKLSDRRKISPFHWEVDYNEIQIHEKIADGSFGNVYRGLWRGIEVAVKKLSPQLMSNTEAFEGFLHEVSLMSQLRHPNVLLFLGACLQPPNIALLTEYMPKGTLYKVLREEKLEWHRKLAIAVETAKGLQYLHTHNPPVLHRDLKSLNLLVDENYHIKVADFGLSQTKALTKVEQKSHSNSNVKGIEIKGTIRWQAPEVFTQGTYTEKSDIYSFGMVLYELLTEKTPYEDKSFLQILNVVDAQNEFPPLPTDCDPDFTQLIQDCWKKDPNSRPDINEVLKRLKVIRAKHLNLQLGTLTEVPTALELPSP